jgi:hypothetical protein
MKHSLGDSCFFGKHLKYSCERRNTASPSCGDLHSLRIAVCGFSRQPCAQLLGRALLKDLRSDRHLETWTRTSSNHQFTHTKMRKEHHSTPSIMTAHQVERNTTLRRAEEQRVSELKQFSTQSRWLSNCAEKESMIDQVRDAKLKSRLAAEEEQRRLLKERQELRQRELASKELERRIMTEMHQQKIEVEKREREIRRICESSEELNELERKLKIAYVDKERAAQHQEAMLIRKLENDREQAIEERMERDRQQDFRHQQENEKNRKQYLVSQRELLQNQMLDKEEQTKKLKEESSLKDNKMVDDIIAKINREDDMEREQRMKKATETRALVLQFQNERTLQKEVLEEEERQQDAEIQAYNEMKEQRYLKDEADKKRNEIEKKRRWEKVADKTQSQLQSSEEYTAIRNMLWEEELEAKQKKAEADAITRQMQLKEEMMRENKAQISAKKEMLEKMEQEERELVKRMLLKFSQDEEEEKRNEENRRKFKQRFMVEASQQRMERDILLQQERERELNEEATQKKREERRQQIIEEAKRLLLQKHSSQLQGFLRLS